MKAIDNTRVTDMLTQLVERTKQTHPQVAANAARRARHYAGQVSAAQEAQRHLDALRARCTGCSFTIKGDPPMRNGGLSFCSRACVERFYDPRQK